jgi:predicted PurR-regulated permease PerM
MKGLQDGLTTFSVIVPFSYVSAALSGTFGHYSGGVVFFKVLMSSLLSFLLDPIKKRLKKRVEMRNASRVAKAKAEAEREKHVNQ